MLLSMYGKLRPGICHRADASRSYALPAGALVSWLERMARKASMRFTIRGGHLRPRWLSWESQIATRHNHAWMHGWL